MRAVIFVNGELSDGERLRAMLRPDDLLIGADGGTLHALTLGLTPHAVIGDGDSLPPSVLADLQAQGVDIRRYPARKDQTDLELALLYAQERGADEVLLVGALGGRWDQTLANLLLCAHPDLRHLPITILAGEQRITAIRGQAVIEGRVGDTVSLLPIGGDASGVTTSGLEYPLMEGRLPFGSSLGVSNVLTAPRATIRVRHGVVLCIHIPQPKEE